MSFELGVKGDVFSMATLNLELALELWAVGVGRYELNSLRYWPFPIHLLGNGAEDSSQARNDK